MHDLICNVINYNASSFDVGIISVYDKCVYVYVGLQCIVHILKPEKTEKMEIE